jgi:hypothetical protein
MTVVCSAKSKERDAQGKPVVLETDYAICVCTVRWMEVAARSRGHGVPCPYWGKGDGAADETAPLGAPAVQRQESKEPAGMPAVRKAEAKTYED